ncbi:uncharacterized protein N7529_000673 [Penicillium soppii]|uniref:uncharacterized protein n=1 Tax=Penicillium soppii TaxID=69789 RepID=UPI002548846D|nr:uncharacterized protein N7529_000673 [Penicillium soppii]KAJ5882001.1 hypothetical protein N7529_000673 [Penicillium soppii]
MPDSGNIQLDTLQHQDRSQQAASRYGERLQSPEQEEGSVEYPSLFRVILITLGVALCSFCVGLDNTILATAIPKITSEFNSLEDMSWYVSAYMLVTSAFTLSFGKIYTYYSVKFTYLISLGLFELGSLICAVTPSSAGLIVGRAIAGFGSAGLFPGSVIILSRIAPLHQRPLLIAFIGIMSGIATVTGPLLGGVFTDRLSWRWCFYINLPIGGVTAVVVFLFLKNSKVKENVPTSQKIKGLDWIGTVVFIPAIVSLLLALQWAGARYNWQNVRIIMLFIIAGVLGMMWVLIQRWKQEEATIPPRLMQRRSMVGTCIYTVPFVGCVIVFGYYLPIWFQSVKGVSASQSGIMNLPTVVGMIVVGLLSSLLISKVGYMVPFLVLGSAMLAVGAGLCSTFQRSSGSSAWIGYQAMIGMGSGLGYQLPLLVIQADIPTADVPVATAVVIFMQNLAGSIFSAIAQNVFQNQLAKSVQTLAPSVNPKSVLDGGTYALSDRFPSDVLPSILQAYNTAVTHTFYVGVAAASLSVFGAFIVRWNVSVKKKVPPEPPVPGSSHSGAERDNKGST